MSMFFANVVPPSHTASTSIVSRSKSCNFVKIDHRHAVRSLVVTVAA